MALIHETALVSDTAQIGDGVQVGAFSIVHPDAVLGDGTIIENHCEIGRPAHSPEDRGPLIIGRDSHIRSHSVFYNGSRFGDRLITGHRVTVREATQAGENLQIGTLGDIQGHCAIGDYVRFHSNVHIGHHSNIGNYIWIFPYVVLTNDPHPPSEVQLGVTVADYVSIATMSVVLPGVSLGQGCLVGAHSSVTRDVAADMVVAGNPAKVICETDKIRLRDGSDAPAYPWRRHFHRGYPLSVVEDWKAEFDVT